MFRTALIVSFAALTTACASGKMDTDQAVTPTERFAIKVTPTPDEILLAPHSSGLSPTQQAAVAAMVDRWRDAGSGPITIQAPLRAGSGAGRVAGGVEAALSELGVPRDAVVLGGYDPGEQGDAPVRVGFTHYVAEGPTCGRDWPNLSSSFRNEPPPNFGCAMTANMAAQVANPGDLLRPQATQAPDAMRREAILGKYRQGEVTSSAKDDQAKGTVSQAVQ